MMSLGKLENQGKKYTLPGLIPLCMVEKHRSLDGDDPRRKFKARGVCLGNQMTDQSHEAAACVF